MTQGRVGLLVVELGLEPWGADQAALLGQLPVDEQQRIQRFRRDADRYRSLAAALLPRLLIARQRGRRLHEIRFERGPSGKPYDPADPGLEFNLSHSGHSVALAVGNRPVGVDIELLRPTLDWQPIAKRFFSADEQRWLEGFDSAEQPQQFVALWSRKESLLKATGEGIAGGLSGFSAIATDPAEPEIAIDHRGRRWFVRSYACLPGYGLALCTGCPGLPQPIQTQARAASLIADLEPSMGLLAQLIFGS
jgi:4'-phosphopantetheinyl transferase